jgi:hypothetical protein
VNEPAVTDYERFQLRVAGALAHWQIVEFRMQEFFVTVIESPDVRWAAAAYNSVVAFRAKLDMLHEILLYRLPEDRLKEWNAIRQTLIESNGRRNRLVHWTFLATFTESNKETYTYISTPFGDTRKGQTGKHLTQADLEEMTTDFGILQNALDIFRRQVIPVLVSPPNRSLRVE